MSLKQITFYIRNIKVSKQYKNSKNKKKFNHDLADQQDVDLIKIKCKKERSKRNKNEWKNLLFEDC